MWLGTRHDVACDRGEPMDAQLTIGVHERGPEQRSELTRCRAPHEIHLEESILRVGESGREGKIDSRAGANRWDAERVPFYRGGSAQPIERELTFDTRETAAQREIERCRDNQGQRGEGGAGIANPTNDAGVAGIQRLQCSESR